MREGYVCIILVKMQGQEYVMGRFIVPVSGAC